MLLLNFSHPLTDAQRSAVEALTGGVLDRVLDVRTQFDHALPFAEQVVALVDGIGLTAQEWQTLPLLVHAPSLSTIACAVLAELHGRCGHFPQILRLRPVGGGAPGFEVAEIVNLQTVRDQARVRR